jgi:alpha-tubulin suppressor-like RCC1 family protein
MMVGEEGGLWVWGINDRGSLGLGDYFHRNHPAQLKIGDSEVTSISLGFKFTLALTKDGNLYTWGRNNFGQLGLGDLVDKTTPQLLVVSEGLLRVSSISAGDSFSVVTLEDGSMYSWGLNTSGQLGLGDTQNRLTPTLIPFPEPVEFTKIACGGHHVLAITKEGHLWVWGRSVSGQLGLGDRVDRPVPTRHPISVGLVDIAVGGFHSVALTREGEMFTWGTNKHGQLGLGDLNGRKEPCKVPLDDVVAVSTGYVRREEGGESGRAEKV